MCAIPLLLLGSMRKKKARPRKRAHRPVQRKTYTSWQVIRGECTFALGNNNRYGSCIIEYLSEEIDFKVQTFDADDSHPGPCHLSLCYNRKQWRNRWEEMMRDAAEQYANEYDSPVVEFTYEPVRQRYYGCELE